jgi:hypothetical protein
VGIFATRSRRTATEGPEAGRALSERKRLGLPPRFEAVGEALASGSGSAEACTVVGWQLAQDGASLPEVLEALRATSHIVVGTEPSFEDVSALCLGWSESTLGYLHQMSCEDPMTGLSSLAHVRTRLGELYRGVRFEREVAERHALVIADLPDEGHWLVRRDPTALKPELNRHLRLARLGDAARTVFAGSEPIGRLGKNRIVVLADRDDRLGRRVAVLRKLVDQLDLAPRPARVWIEGLPVGDAGAAMLLDELSRG